ncbi:interferon-induced protein with tetratricopeptide repeats 1-like [Cynocephalus volans]|uniref:interferon-induced protein with tetratricopeptide repeats 1-like n=1 Tax=Cynocephalus volans TaxID=110931 RepID=UPI002FC9F551
MSKNAEDRQVKDSLAQLRCHFTWKFLIENSEIPDLENRVLDEIEFLDTKYNVGIHNMLAYVKHLKGQNEKALESLKEAEDLIQRDHANQSDMRSLVTWGNYAWVCYHLGRLAEAQTYLDKVESTCEKLASPFRYRMECPEMDCEEGWALLKCGGQNYERAKACFEKALEADPENAEFSIGYAITTYRLDGFNAAKKRTEGCSLHPLRQAIRLNPEDAYIKVLLALKLQEVGQEAEGEKYIEEALTNKSSQTYVFRYAAKFYRKKGSLDKALQLLKTALQATPDSVFLHHQIGCCYRQQMIEMKEATKLPRSREDEENADTMMRLAIYHFELAIQKKPTFTIAYMDLANMYREQGEYQKVEDTYQKALTLHDGDKSRLQEVHYRYGYFLQCHKQSENDAITYYLKALYIEPQSNARQKILSALENLVNWRVDQNKTDVESLNLLALVHRLKEGRE